MRCFRDDWQQLSYSNIAQDRRKADAVGSRGCVQSDAQRQDLRKSSLHPRPERLAAEAAGGLEHACLELHVVIASRHRSKSNTPAATRLDL